MRPRRITASPPVLAVALLPLLAGGCASSTGFDDGGVSSLGGGTFQQRVRKRAADLADFRRIDFAALAAEGREMRNEAVRVRGLLDRRPGAGFTIRDPANRTSATVPVDVRALEPAERQSIAERCTGAASARCETEILGYVQAPLGTDRFYLEAYFLEDRPAAPDAGPGAAPDLVPG